jgi:Peptidase MA superfamily
VKRVWTGLLGVFVALLVLWASPADANGASPAGIDQPVASPPRDVPLVLPSATIAVPPLPATYQERDLGWISIAYPPNVYERVQPLIDEAPAFKARLASELGQPVLGHVEVRVARTADEMAEMSPHEVPPPAYASGVAYPSLHLVVLSLTPPTGGEATELDELFRHELFHVALEDAVRAHHVPLWFNEGMAIFVSGEHPWYRRRTLLDATFSRTVVPLADVDRSFPTERYEVSVAYAESADFVRFLLRDQDQLRFTSLIERVRSGEPFDRALGDAYDTDLRKLEFQWREDIAKRYTFWPSLASGAFVWFIAFGMLVAAYRRKRQRDRVILARWEQEDIARDRAREDVAIAETPGIPAEMRPGLPKVEHEGSWHTLH